MVIQKFLILLFIILPEFAAAKALPRQDDSLFIHNKFCGIGWGARRLPLASLTAFLSHNYGVAPLTSLATSVGIELGISDVILVSNLNRTQNRLSAHIYLPQTTSSSLASF